MRVRILTWVGDRTLWDGYTHVADADLPAVRRRDR